MSDTKTGIERERAVELVNRLVAAECKVVNQINSRARGVSKKAESDERKAARDLFHALVGYWPTDEEESAMVGL